MLEYVEDLLPQEDYTEDEWADLVMQDGFSEEDNCIYAINLDEAKDHAMDKIQQILDNTGCEEWELHFTAGRTSFRYQVLESYKSNRKGGRPPAGIRDLRKLFKTEYPDKAFIWYEWEADDIVVSLKRDNPDKYILCAVDKDVVYALPGRHFNYYQSRKYNIDMKWIEVGELEAKKHHYMQVLTGDSTDGIIGLHGIGPKKAAKLLDGLTTGKEMWEAVENAYRNNKRDIVDALLNMRLISMYQLVYGTDNQYKVKLWRP